MKTKVIITNKQKKIKTPTGLRMLIRRACNATLLMEKFQDDAEINVTFTCDEDIKKVNSEFRNIDSATDVLSFPLGEDGIYDENPETGAKMLGDVLISLERAEVQAEEYGHSFERETAYLTVHSVLHLLGYDHVNGGLEQEIMREKEESVMELLGLRR